MGVGSLLGVGCGYIGEGGVDEVRGKGRWGSILVFRWVGVRSLGGIFYSLDITLGR